MFCKVMAWEEERADMLRGVPYRLFFRYHAAQRIIVFAWVNDDDTKRAYESSDDAYRVFRKMIDTGLPPDDWDTLLKEARGASGRLTRLESST